MSVILIIVLCAATAFVWYQTIQGYRTGVLNIRSRIDRRVSPRLYAVNLVVMAILCLLMLASIPVLIYGETHPEWRRERAKHVLRTHPQVAFQIVSSRMIETWAIYL